MNRILGFAACLIAATPVNAQISILGQTTYPVNGHTYFLTTPASWNDSNAFATSLGGYLFSVNDLAEQDFVVSGLLPFQTTDSNFWIGYNDVAVEGQFVWTSGENISFTNWAAGEPNNCCSGENFAEIWRLDGERTWNDDNDRLNFGVVEIEPVPPPGHVEVDLATGESRFVSDSATDFSLRSYEINSSAGVLAPSLWLNSNLSQRGVDAVNPSQTGQRWETVNAGADQLFESYLFGSSLMSPAEMLSLGRILQPGGAQPDLEVNMFVDLDPGDPSLGDRAIFDVPVQFVSFPSPNLPGDYNDDNLVDAADYTVWRDSLGQTGPGLAADGDGDNSVDADDYTLWKANFGQSSPGVAAAGVPEPATLASVVLVLAMVTVGGRLRLAGA